MQHMPCQRNFPGRQRGAVLVVALIFLMLLTILAISASGSSLLQQKMVSATRNAQLASWGAESALRGVEWDLFQKTSVVGSHVVCTTSMVSGDTCARFNKQSSLFAVGGAVHDFRHQDGWSTSGGSAYTNPEMDFTAPDAAYQTATLAQSPRYMIEDLGPVRPPGADPGGETGTTGMRSGGAGKVNIHVYRITARSTGGNDNAVRAMQSTFSAQTNN